MWTPPRPQGPPEDPGIAPRALQSLFREMRTGGQHRVTLSMVEIYNEAVRSGPCPGCLVPASGPPALLRASSPQEPANQVLSFVTRDLLAPGPPERLAVRQGPAGQGGIQVAGLTYWDVPNLETLQQVRLPSERCGPARPCLVLAPGRVWTLKQHRAAAGKPSRCALQMLSLGRSNRVTAATAMNQHSSRSHALVTLTLRAATPPRGSGTAGTAACALSCGGPRYTGDWSSLHVGSLAPAGTLHLVDLAGSERAWKAGAVCRARGDPDDAQRLRESRTINRSLLALGGVMAALRARRPHVPFRDSQLTRLLQPALGPGATALLLLQVGLRRRRGTGAGRGGAGGVRARRLPLGPAQQRPFPADLHAARGSRRDRVLAQVRRASGPSGAGAGSAPQGPALRDALLAQHRHTLHRDALHPHAVPRQPSQPGSRQRLQLGPRAPSGPALVVAPLPAEAAKSLHRHNFLDLRAR